MPTMPRSDDVAVWLRFQIAAGRVSDDADSSKMNQLAQKLGVTVATISEAFGQVSEARANCVSHDAVRTRGGGFSAVAHLIDRIVEFDGFESDTALRR